MVTRLEVGVSPALLQVMISLLTFIQTGRLGQIGLGSTRTDVELSFGPPDDWETRFPFPKSPVWKYGNIEIFFEQEIVSLICCEEFEVPHMGQNELDPWKICASNSFDQVESWLHEEGIVHRTGWGNVAVDNDEGSWWMNIDGAQVTLRFDDDGQGKRLSSFWCS